MATQPPKKVRVLTRLKISEVSAVDRGAGHQCKVILSKRVDDSADPPPLTNAEKARAQLEGRMALRHAEEQAKREQGESDDRSGPLFEYFLGIFKGVNKTYAADDRGDEGDMQDEKTPADELDGDGDDEDVCPEFGKRHTDGGEHHASQVADMLVETGKHPDRAAALDHLFHTANGQALLRRMRKSYQEESPVSKTANLADLAKRAGVVAIAKAIVDEDHSFGITEPELTDLVIAEAKKNHPELTDAQAFAKVYSEQSEAGVVLRRAFQVAKNSAYHNAIEDAEKDAAAACAELTAIGKARWPSLSRAQQFAPAFETNPAIAKRAHRRPSAFRSTSFAQPVAKSPLTNVDGVTLTPQSVTETNVDNPEAALAQLREIGRQRWPSASQSQAFINAVTDPENAALVRAALGSPKGSSP